MRVSLEQVVHSHEKKGGSGEGGSGDVSFQKRNGYEKGERRFDEDGEVT